MSALEIGLFGGFRLRYRGEAVSTVRQPIVQSLLAYLVIQRATPKPRQHTAAVFWPDVPDADARRNLRNKVFSLRNHLPDADHFLAVDSNVLQWRIDSDFTLDVAVFSQLLARAEQAYTEPEEARQFLEAAVALYQGELLPGFYDDWILDARAQLSDLYVAALDNLIRILEAQRDFTAALDYARRLLAHDPIHEGSYRCLMRLYALNGDLPHALRMYQECVATLAQELGVEPSSETQSLHQRILNREVGETASAHVSAPTVSVLVGREAQQEILQAAWRHALQGRRHVFLLRGEAGIGKTRLAEDVVWQCGRHGVVACVTRCYRDAGDLAYAPIVKWLRSDLLFPLVTGLDRIWRTELARILPELLSLDPELQPHRLSATAPTSAAFRSAGSCGSQAAKAASARCR
ncbi:MAG: BTAD domain-containing putative transcriptional regulator [Caldilineaceae bacterium]